MVRAVPPVSQREEIRDANTRYHDVAADHYDSKWGIDFGDVGEPQVVSKVRKALGRRAAPLRATRWRSARAPATSRSTCCAPG